MRKYILSLLAVLLMTAPAFGAAGDPVREGKEIASTLKFGASAYLDLGNVTDTNIPYMQAAGAGFGDSPLSRTDAETVTINGKFVETATTLSAAGPTDNLGIIAIIFECCHTRIVKRDIPSRCGRAKMDSSVQIRTCPEFERAGNLLAFPHRITCRTEGRRCHQ